MNGKYYSTSTATATSSSTSTTNNANAKLSVSRQLEDVYLFEQKLREEIHMQEQLKRRYQVFLVCIVAWNSFAIINVIRCSLYGYEFSVWVYVPLLVGSTFTLLFYATGGLITIIEDMSIGATKFYGLSIFIFAILLASLYY